MPSEETKPPLFTVVIVSHNRRDELLHTLGHMTGLPDSGPIVVVDNASTDDTSAAVTQNYPEVTLMRSSVNLGAVARNWAVEGLDTPFVAFCDDDMRWQPGALIRASALLEAHPKLGCLMGRVLVEPELGEDPLTPELRHSPLPAPEWLPGPALLGVMAGACMVRTRAFREVGGFSRRLWFGGEEELLIIDLAVRGYWTCWAEDVVLHHSASPIRDSKWRRGLGVRNALWTTWLRWPLAGALRRTIRLLRSAPMDVATLVAVLRALRGFPWVLRERKVVPSHVEHGLRLLEDEQLRAPARSYV